MRYTVLTYHIGKYELVHEIEEKDPEAEYVLVTDQQNLQSSTWHVIFDPELEGLSTFNRCYMTRFNIFKYCTTDICLRVDGSIGIKKSLKPIIDYFEDGHYDLCLMPHPQRSTIEEEYKVWVKERGYSQQQAERCMSVLRAKGYDVQCKGLYQGGFMITRRGEIARTIETQTMSLLLELGTKGKIERLDQTVLSAVINKECAHLKVLPVSSQVLSSYYMQLYLHGSDKHNLFHLPDLRQKNVRFMFGRKVECVYFLTPCDEASIGAREYELLMTLRANIYRAKRRMKKIRQHLTYVIVVQWLIIVALALLLLF
ncbi:MAG: hypothetical protein KBT12_06800 [Bacteroidales bacterium]|nr:hypothetical protein [Candidatus Physcousia equi]